MTPKLHDYQSANIDEIRAHFKRRTRTVLWYLPTGAGKSYAAGFMLRTAAANGHRCWFIVHRRELLRQTERTFQALGIDYGVIAAGRPPSPSKLVQICSMGTLMRRIDKLTAPHFIALDEAHHVACKSWSDVVKKLKVAYIVGLSASPCRSDGRGLGEYFGAIVRGLGIRELIARGFLSPFRTFAPPTVDTSGLHTRGGDYKTEESEALMDTPSITGSAVAEYRKLCDGKRAIVFCVSIEHSKHVAAQFREAGYAALHIDGTTDDQIRDMAIDDFERGAIQILCNVDLCGEGLSINAIECVILLRPTQSLAVYIQQVGRGLRTWPGKQELTILDHVGATERFGMIDEPREWTLEGDSAKRAKEPAPSVRVCAKCFAASSARARACIECGAEFPVKARQEPDERAGELVELTAEELAKNKEKQWIGYATLDQLIAYGKSKGYAKNWPYVRYAMRKNKRAQKETA